MTLRTFLAISVMFLGTVPETFAQTDRTQTLEARVTALEQQVELLSKQLAALNPKKVTPEAAEETTATANREMESIYKSLKITNARIVGGPFAAGDIVTVAYDMTNSSDVELQVPVDNSYSRPFNLVGTRQHWVERQGDESTIQGIPERIAREGSKYAAGGSIIPTNTRIAAGESLGFEQRISTTEYPAGKYTYYIEYKKIRGETIQTEEVHFELTHE